MAGGFAVKSSKSSFLIPFRFQRITRRREGGAAGVFTNTLRKPTTLPTKLAKESELVCIKMYHVDIKSNNQSNLKPSKIKKREYESRIHSVCGGIWQC